MVGPQDRLSRLRRIFDRVVLACETAGVGRPDDLPWSMVQADPDLLWLTEESTASMWGLPVDGERPQWATVLPRGTAGFVYETLTGLHEALLDALKGDRASGHVANLNRHRTDERHLFGILGMYDLPFPLIDALVPKATAFIAATTATGWDHAPVVGPEYGRRVLLGTANGWTQYRLDRSPAVELLRLHPGVVDHHPALADGSTPP